MSAANKAIIRRLFEEVLNSHNVALHSELYGDFVFHAPAVGELRKDEHREFLDSIFSALPDAHWTIEDQVAEDDKVVTRWTFTATHTGTFMGIAPSGNRITSGGICIDRVANGKIAEEWEEWDTLGMIQQIGTSASQTTIGDLVAP